MVSSVPLSVIIDYESDYEIMNSLPGVILDSYILKLDCSDSILRCYFHIDNLSSPSSFYLIKYS